MFENPFKVQIINYFGIFYFTVELNFFVEFIFELILM